MVKHQYIMNTIFYPAAERGSADWGWLNAKHSFSFGQWYHHDKVHFGALRVLNDDIIDGGGGFPTHPHDNMEIITIPFTGALLHKDSTGGQGYLAAGDVQVMSAGTGVQHSEYNASATQSLTLFQIWIYPKVRNIPPRYDQKTFAQAERFNKWQTVATGNQQSTGALWINQDAAIALTKLAKGNSITYNNQFKGNGVYLMLINGTAQVGNLTLSQRDAAGVFDTDEVAITATEDSEILAIEVPMKF
jgi:hypothetical protein